MMTAAIAMTIALPLATPALAQGATDQNGMTAAERAFSIGRPGVPIGDAHRAANSRPGVPPTSPEIIREERSRSMGDQAAAGTGQAASDATGGGWDADGDGMLDRDEFKEGFRSAGSFGEWDANGDGRLTREEFAPALWRIAETQGDDRMTVAEWDNAIDQLYGEQGADLSVGNWDENGDGYISRQEFVSTFPQTDLATTLVPDDAGVEEDRLADSWFDIIDSDRDRAVSRDEFGFDRLG